MTPSGVLPPYVSGFPNNGPASSAPYLTSMTEIAGRFCTSAARVKLFQGLVTLRAELRALGIQGIQWVDGSFCEDVEAIRGRPPQDIDIVTLLVRPATAKAQPAWGALWAANSRVFDASNTKVHFGCEAFYVDGEFPAVLVADQIAYWFGLFSHQRVSFLWKGMLQIELSNDDADDVAASAVVAGLTFGP